MRVLIGHASISEKGTINGERGDSTTKEVCIRTWYSKPWEFMAIHPDADVREKHAKAIEAACANNNIGYGQGDRNTLNALAKAVGYDLSKVGKCNCDCSSLQNVAAVASGASGVSYGSNGWVTSNMKSKLKAAGYIIITDSKYLTSEEYCVRGAIYVKASSHTVCGLQNGSKANDILVKAGIVKDSGESEKTTATDKKNVKVDYARSRNDDLKGKYEVITDLYLRAGAGTKKDILAVMPQGATVQCYGYYTNIFGTKWLYVTYNGITGFASSKYLKK